MSRSYTATRANIERRLTLAILRGDLDESVAEVWREAFRSLNDAEMAALIRLLRDSSPARVSAITLRFLMEHYYPFREMVLYETDETFKRRMMLHDYLDDGKGW